MSVTVNETELMRARVRVDSAAQVIDQVRARHAVELRDAELAHEQAQRAYEAALGGMDLHDFDAVTAVFDVWNRDGALAGDDRRVIDEAIHELATTGGLRFAREYTCSKNYDQWHHQRVGWTNNKMAPRHGSLAFVIALRSDATGIAPELVDPAIRYLEAVRAGRVPLPRAPYWERGR